MIETELSTEQFLTLLKATPGEKISATVCENAAIRCEFTVERLETAFALISTVIEQVAQLYDKKPVDLAAALTEFFEEIKQ